MKPDAALDAAFSEVSAYGSTAWVAARLGRSLTWFRANREQLDTAGFPKADLITGRWLKSDVDRWIDDRSARNPSSAQMGQKPKTNGVNDERF